MTVFSFKIGHKVKSHRSRSRLKSRSSVVNFIAHVIIAIQLCMLPIACSHRFTASDDKDEFTPHSHINVASSKSAAHHAEQINDHLPLLLWWTRGIFPHAHGKSLSKITCNIGQCHTTTNRKYFNDRRTQIILFYGTEVTATDLPLPREPWHNWALIHEESPLNNYMLCHEKFIRLFNYTATCRRESDFPLATQWIPDLDYLISRPPVSIALKNKLKEERGNAPVLYIQSHCAVPADRDRYVKELMKYIPIDSYGKCLKNKDIPENFEGAAENLYNQDFYDFIAPYKFHLAFENAYLEDYMTEKLMRTLHLGSIPIYKGAPNANDWMPNNKSVIFVDDFASPKDLAEFIKRLDEDDYEYESYLKYKTEGISNTFLKETMKRREWADNLAGYPDKFQSYECYLCDEITKYLTLKKTHSTEAKYANKSHYGCSQPYTLLVDPDDVPSGDTWREVDWIELYWMGFDHAIVADEMIRSKENDSSKFYTYLRKLGMRRRGN